MLGTQKQISPALPVSDDEVEEPEDEAEKAAGRVYGDTLYEGLNSILCAYKAGVVNPKDPASKQYDVQSMCRNV